MKTSLSSINLLSELEKAEYRDFRAGLSPLRFAKHSLVSSCGPEQDQVFIVQQGRLRIYLAVEDKDFSLAVLEPGDIYATHTRVHIEALEDAVLLFMPTSRLHACMAVHPALSRTIISILGTVLKQSFSIIESLVFKDIRQRLTDFFLHEAADNGVREEHGAAIRLSLTTTQLAAIVGSSRQTVSTIMGDMLRDGVLVKKRRGVFLIPNLDLLRNSARL